MRPVLVFLLSGGLLPLGGGLVGLANVPCMRRLMARHPWRVWDGCCQVLPLGGGQPALLPAGPGGRLLAVVAWRWNWRVLGIRQDQVWYAVDPLHGHAVAAPPGGSVLLWRAPRAGSAARGGASPATSTSPETGPPATTCEGTAAAPRQGVKKSAMSLASRSGTSAAAKCPPRGKGVHRRTS